MYVLGFVKLRRVGKQIVVVVWRDVRGVFRVLGCLEMKMCFYIKIQKSYKTVVGISNSNAFIYFQ